jgi:single-strand DNA-binding protein
MLNKIMLIGNVGNDPKSIVTKTGTKFVTFSIATTRKHTDKDGNSKSHTTWHNIKTFGKKAEVAEKYIHKGMKVYIEGEQNHDKSDDGKYFSSVTASTFEFLEPKANNSEESVEQEGMSF